MVLAVLFEGWLSIAYCMPKPTHSTHIASCILIMFDGDHPLATITSSYCTPLLTKTSSFVFTVSSHKALRTTTVVLSRWTWPICWLIRCIRWLPELESSCGHQQLASHPKLCCERLRLDLISSHGPMGIQRSLVVQTLRE